MDKIKTEIQNRIHHFRYVRSRKQFSTNDLKAKRPNITASLSVEEKHELKILWNGYLSRKRSKWFALYKSLWPGCELKYFIPDDFYYFYIDEFFAKRRECKIIDDKNLYDFYFNDMLMPRTIARCVEGVLMSADYNPITIEEFIEICKHERRVIIKEGVDSEGGKGVSFYNIEEDEDSKLVAFGKMKNFVVQEVINQHSELAKLHPESVNTVRIMTFFFEGEVHVLSAVVRMGVGKSKVDNASSGGIVCGINLDGTLKNKAYDVKANCYHVHPSGVHFESVKVPNFAQLCSLCKKLAPRFVRFTRLISWDFAIDTKSRPVLIEANLSYGQIDFHQMCNGPIFGSMSEKIIKYIFDNNPLIRYRL